MHNPKTCKHDHNEDGQCIGYESGSPEQKEEWEKQLLDELQSDSMLYSRIAELIRTQLAIAEERGRDAQQKEDYEIAKAQQEKAFKSGTEMGEERGRMEEARLFMESIQKKAETVQPNLLLNEVVNYAYDRIKTLTQKS